MKRKRDYEEGSGNVFADLGFRNSKQELLKAKLTVEIYKLLKKRGVTQNEAAKLLGTTQAQVSALMRCKRNPPAWSHRSRSADYASLIRPTRFDHKPAKDFEHAVPKGSRSP